MSETNSPDFIQTLLEKINAVLIVNYDNIQFIESRRGQKVICKNKITVSAKEPHRKRKKVNLKSKSDHLGSNNEELFRIVNEQVTKEADDVIKDWRYNGQPLKRETSYFKNFIDLRLERYEDLSRLNDKFAFLAAIYSNVCVDRLESYEAIEAMVDNVETLQVAIGDIYGQLLDTKNPVEENKIVEQEIKAISKAMKRIRETVPEIEFDITPQFKEINDEENVSTPSSIDFCSISCKENLKEIGSRRVNALQDYIVDGKQCLAAAQDNGIISLWDAEKKTTFCSLKGHNGPVYALALCNWYGCQMLISSSGDKSMKLWNLETRSLVKTINNFDSVVGSVEVVKINDKNILISGDWKGTIKLYNLKDCTCIAKLMGHSKSISSLLLYELYDDYYLASGSADRYIKLWSLKDYREITTLNGHQYGIKKLISTLHKGTTILVSLDTKGLIKVWNLENNHCIRDLSAPDVTDLELVHCNKEPRLVCIGSIFTVMNLSGEAVKQNDYVESIRCSQAFKNGRDPCIAL